MAYISNDEINEIRSKANIVDIISSYLQVSMKGKNYVALCPFHSDHSPSLMISSEKQIFNCFTCRTGGNVFSFVMKYENVSFPEAVSIVAKKIGYDLKSVISLDKKDNKYSKDYEIYDFAVKYYLNNINTSDGIKAREYLLNRGINEEIIKEFKLGYALINKDSFYKVALNKGWNVDELDKLGLINKINENIYDTFINRIIIPIEDLAGNVVGFTGRIFNDENTAKYLNTKETEIFKKGHILFNYYNAKKYIKDRRSVIVVEGNMDAIKMSAKGFKNTIALMGVALSKEQIDVLKKLRVPIILMLDNDSAGLDATIKNGSLLIDNEIDVRVVRLSGAKDPDEYLEKFGIDAMQNNIDKAIKYLDFKIDVLKQGKDLSNLEDLIIYVREVIESVNNQDELTKEVILSKISKDYGIDIEVLKKSINKDVKIKSNKKNVTNEYKLSKYQKASHKVLYYMLMDKKYISLYKNMLGFFKEKIERILASEIIYFASVNDSIDVADFTTNIMKKEDEFEFLQIILSENGNTSISDEEFNSCIEAILKIYKIEEIEKVKDLIAGELDQRKKEELICKLIELKKEV